MLGQYCFITYNSLYYFHVWFLKHGAVINAIESIEEKTFLHDLNFLEKYFLDIR